MTRLTGLRGWLLDTNIIGELSDFRGSVRVHGWALSQPVRSMYISVLTLGEYEKGVSYLDEGHALRKGIAATMAGLERRFAGRILPVSDEVVRRWGVISGTVKRATRQSPPVIDTLLAATAAVHELCLVTRNVRDVRHAGVPVFNPWVDDPAQVPFRFR